MLAQDPALSQFFAHRTYLNPAFTGLEAGLQFSLSARNQWLAADRGYNFVTATAEWQEPCWHSGFGLSVSHAAEGLAPVSTSSASGLYSFSLVSADERRNLHLGLRAGFAQKKLDWGGLLFSDELDPVDGAIYPTAVPSAGRQTASFFDVGLGAVYRWDSKLVARGESKRSFRSHLGFAIHHFGSLLGSGPDEAFLTTKSELPARLTLHGGTVIPLEFLEGVRRKLTISPNFRFETQGKKPFSGKNLSLFSGGMYFIFLNRFTTGLFYNSRSPILNGRNTNSLTTSFGFSSRPLDDDKYNSFYIGISVDANVTGLGIRSNNVYELNFRYAFRRVQTFCERGSRPAPGWSRGKVMPCPNFAY